MPSVPMTAIFFVAKKWRVRGVVILEDAEGEGKTCYHGVSFVGVVVREGCACPIGMLLL